MSIVPLGFIIQKALLFWESLFISQTAGMNEISCILFETGNEEKIRCVW